jgi:hypothetical protein
LPLPTLAWAQLLLAPAVIFIVTCSERYYQTDFWHHLARGRAMALEGRLIDHDQFTYTVPGQPFQDATWLTQLFYYGLYRLGGFELVLAVNSLTLAAMLALLVWLCSRASGSALVACCLGMLTFLGLWQVLVVRPQTFSLLLFVLLYGILQAAERRRALLLVPPVLLALWTNVHGGFPVGLLLVGCFTLATTWEAGRQRGLGLFWDRHVWGLGLCLVACALATLVNPYGWKVHQWVHVTSATAMERHIDEWMPTSLHLLIGKVWLASMLLLAVLMACGRRRPTVRDVCLVLCFLPLSCISVRMVAWWLLVTAPISAALLADRLSGFTSPARDAQLPSAAAALACLLLLTATVLSLPWLGPWNPLVAAANTASRPETDLEQIAQRLGTEDSPRRIFSRFEWGEYLGWVLSPRAAIFMDGRIEIYPDDVWTDYQAITYGQAEWESILDRHGVDGLLLDTTYHRQLLALVEQSPQWIFADQVGRAVLFVRAPL